ncbi:MAG: EscU/YscU/HrcU family type III secretion system export apparatus switch protein [Sulfurimonadaceae bacterium]|jgi:flagellar biosynthesis protein|nr:EscU/YscU/HrcU family type III secretion system export apparatus switch protein [Sulfurimonadaceae bacterium]
MATKAAALSYDEKSAPKVVASGKGSLAQKIIEKAEEFSIPLFANEALVNSLVELDIDREIPAELYQTVVEVFVWLMKNETKK